jgi:glutamyl-tRNA synthetase
MEEQRKPADGSAAAAQDPSYRGRLAPSPTGYLHIGHARTFRIAMQRARRAHGTLILREEDLDTARVRPEFRAAMLEDLRWLGLEWQEGPDVGGPFAPYVQSKRLDLYGSALETLIQAGLVFPCRCSRSDVQRALGAPHPGDEEPIYPGTCRSLRTAPAGRFSWRFRVPDGEEVAFTDGCCGPQRFVAGRDFGDFVVWRPIPLSPLPELGEAGESAERRGPNPGRVRACGEPAYQLAVVLDDALMQVTEVVRGADLLLSTARQLLLYRALGWSPPLFYHCPLVTDEHGVRLAKRHDALSLRRLRESGADPDELMARFETDLSTTRRKYGLELTPTEGGAAEGP